MKEQNEKTVEGLGIAFNVESHDLGGFKEVISPSSVGSNLEVLRQSDIVFLLNHNYDRGVLARATNGKGSLGLTVTDAGVKYNFTAPKNGAGPELVENLERGEIRGSSFAFIIQQGGEIWEKRKNDYLRTITKFAYIYDISAVYRPAYEPTSCMVRSAEGLTRNMSDTWHDGYARAERSNAPTPLQYKMINIVEMLNLKEGERIGGEELTLLIRMVEERGVRIPEVPPSMVSRADAKEFRSEFISKASDLKPSITKGYRRTPEEEALFARNKKLSSPGGK